MFLRAARRQILARSNVCQPVSESGRGVCVCPSPDQVFVGKHLTLRFLSPYPWGLPWQIPASPQSSPSLSCYKVDPSNLLGQETTAWVGCGQGGLLKVLSSCLYLWRLGWGLHPGSDSSARSLGCDWTLNTQAGLQQPGVSPRAQESPGLMHKKEQHD